MPSYSVVAFGAKADAKTCNTQAVQQAIDAATKAGGGTVVFPAGKYVIGAIVLKNNVTLSLDNGAVLLGSTNLDDYPRHTPAYRSYSDTYVSQALIYAENARNIGIVGRGTIDGRGGHPTFAVPPGESGYLRRPDLLRIEKGVRINCGRLLASLPSAASCDAGVC